MTYRMKLTTLALATGLMAAAASSSLADFKNGSVTGFSPDPLKVLSNGHDYTKLDVLGMTNVAVNLKYDTEVGGAIKSWSASPVIYRGYGTRSEVPNMWKYKVSKSYPLGSRPSSMNRNEAISVPGFELEPAAVGMCNLLADNLRNQGKSDNVIFGTDREVSFELDVAFSVDASGAGSGDPVSEVHEPRIVKIVCQKWHGSQVPTVGGVAAKVGVKKATMQLKEVATMAGACMVKLTTAISTNTANATIKYRYVHSSGKKSKTFTVKTAANKIAVVKHQWDIPNKAGKEQGWMQMEGVNVSFKSNQKAYYMDCKKAPGGIAPNPKKPTVRIPLGGTGKLSN